MEINDPNHFCDISSYVSHQAFDSDFEPSDDCDEIQHHRQLTQTDQTSNLSEYERDIEQIEDKLENDTNQVTYTRSKRAWWNPRRYLEWLDDLNNGDETLHEFPFGIQFFSRTQIHHFMKCAIFFVLAGVVCHGAIWFEYQYCTKLWDLSVWLWSGSYVCEAANRMSYYSRTFIRSFWLNATVWSIFSILTTPKPYFGYAKRHYPSCICKSQRFRVKKMCYGTG